MPAEQPNTSVALNKGSSSSTFNRYFNLPRRYQLFSISKTTRAFPKSIQRVVAQSIFADLVQLESSQEKPSNSLHRFVRTCDLDIGGIIHYEIPYSLAAAKKPEETSLCVKTVFGDHRDPNAPGMLAADLFDAFRAEVIFIPTFSCTSFVVGQVMNYAFRGDIYRPMKCANGFSVEASPIVEPLRSDVQRFDVKPIMKAKTLPLASGIGSSTSSDEVSAESSSSFPPTLADAKVSSFPDDIIPFPSAAALDIGSDLSSSSIPSLASQSSNSSSDSEIALGSSISTLDDGNIFMAPLSPPPSTVVYGGLPSFDDYSPPSLSPLGGVRLEHEPSFLQSLQPRTILGRLNGERPKKAQATKIKSKKTKTATKPRKYLGKENIDPNFAY